ncbi:hypothetical protein BOW53_13430 [Solemya pervernicosa gill symbiont]|uniref:Pilus assembly protein MshO n=2 Tax=Gammaproteobacteria incertae sedis TaxID=118884 RepID=A0A1T2L1L9_9GAMM|nr:prepilin-type N-terminal cleavage/methylation domain-containing protein [Candidatus Reidiella endopervernicosa]OOZ38997.1 hypothetical protein BOW53_13430 [Solemya pervernicosa gill symbiont]QKQ25466.1 prepilin-type N-terminal cleavage/methylation domain-containing protein [Candidatus Reidiella endopervernicosa]
MRRCAGFTLIEMIMVIIITGIIATVLAGVIKRPIDGYLDLTRRAELVDAADSALRLIARDIRRALPNSVRVDSTGPSLEMINTVDAVRYRLGPPGNQSKRLRFNPDDDEFNTIGEFTNLTPPVTSSTDYRLVIYNLGISGASAYENANVITPAATQVTITDDGTSDHIALSSAFQFAFESPRQRLYVVDASPVSYICDTANETLRRYASYSIGSTQPSGSSVVVTKHLTACSISYDAGSTGQAALVTLSLTLSDGGESVTMLHQVRVDNVP